MTFYIQEENERKKEENNNIYLMSKYSLVNQIGLWAIEPQSTKSEKCIPAHTDRGLSWACRRILHGSILQFSPE